MFSFFPLQPRNTRFSEGDTVGKKKKFFNSPGCLAAVPCFPDHTPCHRTLWSKGLQVHTVAHWFPFKSPGSIMLSTCKKTGHVLTTYKSTKTNSSLQFWFHSLKPAMTPSSAWEEWFLSSPVQFPNWSLHGSFPNPARLQMASSLNTLSVWDPFSGQSSCWWGKKKTFSW